MVPDPPALNAPPESLLTTTKERKEEEETAAQIILPPWLNRKTCRRFVTMCIKSKKSQEPESVVLLLRTLTALHDEGEDVNAVIEQSIMNPWVGLFR